MHCKFSKPDHEANLFIMTVVVNGLIDYVLTILNTKESTMSLIVSILIIEGIKCFMSVGGFSAFLCLS